MAEKGARAAWQTFPKLTRGGVVRICQLSRGNAPRPTRLARPNKPKPKTGNTNPENWNQVERGLGLIMVLEIARFRQNGESYWINSVISNRKQVRRGGFRR